MTIDKATIETTYGPVRGKNDGRLRSWKGIRYAAPPLGQLRFRAPQPPKRWTGFADATAFGSACPQPPLSGIPVDLGAPQSEDCLFLNIWAPSTDGAAKPVMVWLHGGAYILGSASQPLYNGRRLATSGDIVVVTVNYRLGALGFLDLSSLPTRRRFDTNIGLRDVLAALGWVRDNIAAFGGDPHRVTVFGESAGAGIITTLLAMPAAEGLFANAIAQSSPATSVYDRDRARRVAEIVLTKLGIDTSDADRLHSVPIPAILAASKEVFDEVPVRNPGTLAFVPIVDGDLLTDYPVKLAQEGRSHPVPLIIGTNKHEAALFRLMRSPLMPITPRATYWRVRRNARYLSIASDVGFRMPSVWLAEGHCAVAPVYMYRFDYSTPLLKLLLVGAAHATELPYVWGTLGGPRDPTLRLGGARTAKAISKRMRTRWVNFATNGKTTGPPGEPEWTPYEPRKRRACLLIDSRDTVVADLDAHRRAAWGNDIVSFR